MARKNSKQSAKESVNPLRTLPQETKRAIIAVFLVVVGIIFTLAYFGAAGNGGSDVYTLFNYLLGVGYFLVPMLFFILAWSALRQESNSFHPLKLVASAIFIFAGLGFVDIVSGRGGLVGDAIAHPAVNFFDIYAALILLGGLSLISLLILIEGKISTAPFVFLGHSFALLGKKIVGLVFKQKEEGDLSIAGLPEGEDEEELAPTYERADEDTGPAQNPLRRSSAPQPDSASATRPSAKDIQAQSAAANLKSLLGEYTPPPLSLLERDKGRPGVGDIKANANIIKRTLANFGIVVELDEISIGPSVTRYAIKPAEGVRLQKILSLQTNLELALAAHPVRIEAPIPGKSLVGIEVPNSAKVTVGLGTLLEAKEFADSPKPLLVALGRDIVGNSHFGNIAKMPHMLIAGATGSGKSVTIHAIITSLLYRAGPQQLRFLMIDPKRVELTLYNKIPHLLSPVITDPKKAIMALRWAGREMERRYNILEEHRVRDIDSYHQNVLTPALERIRKEGKPEEGEAVPEAMPYIVVVIDELADIMQTFPRELEAAIVRLAQMSRAVGIHLLLSTQRPSVNVITGLIKANVPSRLALQVASQIDSRTILDQGGAEKLLGAGDMLYLGGDMGKPVRLQSAFIGEGEVKKVTDFIAKNNDVEIPIDIAAPAPGVTSISLNDGGSTGGGLDEEVDDDMYEAAHAAVLEAGKASTSYIQRKLRVGYARAARLVDMLEERGVIGPGDGAKPREVLGRAPVAGDEPHDMSAEV
ncbi:MAG: DNA translocase FtsK 4TM domain-containing protein [Candidatus Adlerbacteria bacterium]